MNSVIITRSKKRTTIGIQVLPDASVKVTVPFFIPKFYVTKLLSEKEEWIRNAQQSMLAKQKTTIHDGFCYYLGKKFRVVLHPGQKEIVQILHDTLSVATTNNKFVKTYLESWYKQEARTVISNRVNYYAKQAGLSFKSIAITTAETRWGSCSQNKTLNFNWKLIMAPLEVIDYVVTHELAHLTELNHSRAFWERVRKMYPLYREYRTWLKRNGHHLSL